MIPRMRSGDDTRMLDRAPILLGASGHFPHVRDQPVGVAAEGAIHLFDPVQVGKLVPIDREIPTTWYPCDAVDREAHALIQRHPKIEQDERKKQRVDDRCG